MRVHHLYATVGSVVAVMTVLQVVPASAENVQGITDGQGSLIGSSSTFWTAGSGDAYLVPDNQAWNNASPVPSSPGLSLVPPTGGANPIVTNITNATSNGGTASDGGSPVVGPAAPMTLGGAPAIDASSGAGGSVSSSASAAATTPANVNLVPVGINQTTSAASADPIATSLDPPQTSNSDPPPTAVPTIPSGLGGLALLGLVMWLIPRRGSRAR